MLLKKRGNEIRRNQKEKNTDDDDILGELAREREQHGTAGVTQLKNENVVVYILYYCKIEFKVR